MKKLYLASLASGLTLLTIFVGSWFCSFQFKYTPREDLVVDQAESSAVIRLLQKDVTKLASSIGPRSFKHPENLSKASGYIQGRYKELGYQPELQKYKSQGQEVENIYAIKKSSDEKAEVLIIGAHYDTQFSNPGADDNASGVAVLLALMKALANAKLSTTIHFVSFVNEEFPYGLTPLMGSYQYAKMIHDQNLPVKGMISLESVGYFDSAKDSQRYPLGFLNLLYPNSADFIAVVGNLSSHRMVSEIVEGFQKSSPIKSEGAALPEIIRDIARSDHWAFWKFGFEAVMVTDTANFRNANYHKSTDHPDTLSYEHMHLVYLGLLGYLEGQ